MPVITCREADIVACLIDTLCAPKGELPPVAKTEAVSHFEVFVAAAPAFNRVFFRALVWIGELMPVLVGYRRRLRSLPRRQRQAALERWHRSDLLAARSLFEALADTVYMVYYSDDEVQSKCGYDAEANVARGVALREREGRV